jgi:16S rRNA (guanine527-N7)-methyltransferase
VSRRARSPNDGWSSGRREPEGVSRETGASVDVPSPPPAAHVVFGESLERVERYARLLAGAGVERGLLGPREVARLWDRHLLNCGVLAPLVPADASLCDVGTGAGLPGLVIALARPDVSVTLLDPLLRRADFLIEATAELGVANASVVRARAEEHEGRYDVVTARAVAPLGRLARVAMGLCRPGGSLWAVKGEQAEEELRSAEPELPRWGVASWSVEKVGEGVVSPPTTIVRLVARSRGARRRR